MFYVVYSDVLLMVRHRACRKEEAKHVVMGTALPAHRDCRLGFGRIENAAAFIAKALFFMFIILVILFLQL